MICHLLVEIHRAQLHDEAQDRRPRSGLIVPGLDCIRSQIAAVATYLQLARSRCSLHGAKSLFQAFQSGARAKPQRSRQPAKLVYAVCSMFSSSATSAKLPVVQSEEGAQPCCFERSQSTRGRVTVLSHKHAATGSQVLTHTRCLLTRSAHRKQARCRYEATRPIAVTGSESSTASSRRLSQSPCTESDRLCTVLFAMSPQPMYRIHSLEAFLHL
jgi:hypothetical protein